MTDIFPTWKFLLRTDIQKELESGRKCRGHGYGFAVWGDPDLPHGFFDDIHNVACEIASMVDGVDGIEIIQAKEKWGATRIYDSAAKKTKMAQIGTYDEVGDNPPDPITMPLALRNAYELARRRYPYLAHYIGEYPSVENRCRCAKKGYDALHLCENYAKYYHGKVRKTKQSDIAWDLVRLLPRVDASTKEKARKVTADIRKSIKPFAGELQTFRNLLTDPTTPDKELERQWDRVSKAAKSAPEPGAKRAGRGKGR